mgnify:CR=1 FL=1
MKVRRYLGKTKQEALEKVRHNLGNDAIILSSRKIRQGGIKGFFSKPLIEIVAAVDDFEPSFDKEDIKPEPTNPNNKVSELKQQIRTMNMRMDKLITKLDDREKFSESSFSLQLEQYFKQLTDKEVQSEIAKKIIEEAYDITLKENIDFSRSLDGVISRYLGYSRPMSTKLHGQKVVLFIGPTGVGKTTTLAKLAAIYSIKYNYNVGLVTTDTYRIAAVDQLKIYSEILDIPLEIIYTPIEITESMKIFADKDIIFIDTAGKSIKDTEQPEEINTLITLTGADEIFLCISASTSYQGCINIIKSYEFLNDYSIIYTKTDEVTSYGNIFNCCYISGKPMSYMTTGQSVPDDIKVLHPSTIKNNLIG